MDITKCAITFEYTYDYPVVTRVSCAVNCSKVVCTAFTGMAASQHIDGMEFQTTFSVPARYESSSLIPLSPSNQEAERFKNASLLVNDEAPKHRGGYPIATPEEHLARSLDRQGVIVFPSVQIDVPSLCRNRRVHHGRYDPGRATASARSAQ